MMLAFQALGGSGAILALPGIDMLDAASRHFFDVKASEAIKLAGGEEDAPMLSRMAAFGVPGLKGMDLTNYVGPGGFQELTMGLLGPTVSDVAGWGEFFASAWKDITGPAGRIQGPTVERWMQKTMPAQIRRFDRGFRLGSGKDILGRTVQAPGEVRNPYSGKLIYRPDERLRTVFGMELRAGVGVPDIRTSVARMKDEIVDRETKSYNDARESFRRQIALAHLSGDRQGAQTLQLRAQGAGFAFTPAQIRNAIEVFGATAAERREMRSPKAIRTEMEDYFLGF
jgi:hypothetical protein